MQLRDAQMIGALSGLPLSLAPWGPEPEKDEVLLLWLLLLCVCAAARLALAMRAALAMTDKKTGRIMVFSSGCGFLTRRSGCTLLRPVK
jgi:hypothetical protein